ncbi:MAG: FAD-dependent oxidoreductase [Planctomycetia bacterium]|nr:FAD-dependent oxidoreductase [Planctomycetia bacterium]
MKAFASVLYRTTILSIFLLMFFSSVQAQALKNHPDTYFLEAEGFSEKGGWFVDQQYMDQLGSPVLLAHGFGNPVADASSKIVFAKKGKYNLFVRTRNWVAPWTTQYAPGKFQLIIDGKTNPVVFGTVGNPWNWQKGSPILIEKDGQESTVVLHDLTGFDGRVDAICFSADPGFTPPNDKASLSVLRKQALNLPDTIPSASVKPFDLVVVGGGIAGICSAMSAARYGLQVALVQDRPVLGGNTSTEIRVHLCGRINLDPYPNLGNLTWLMGPHAGGNGREAAHYKDQQRLDLVKAEKTLHLFTNFHVNKADVKREGAIQKITAVYGQNIETGQILKFEGSLFTDCTGDGTLGYLAGADWRMGRESRAETGEDLAPEKGDKLTMGASIQWNTIADEKDTSFPVLPWAIQFNEKTIRPMIHGDWDWETGMNRDQINDIEWIRDNGLRAAYGHWSYMKNKIKDPVWKEKVKNLKFGWVSCVAGKRESRRLMGDVVLQEQHLVNAIPFNDASVTTTWGIDLHYPEPQNAKDFPGEEFRSHAPTKHIKPYPIPYRCLYSRNINNLMMAGRQISVTHVALGSTRVMRTCGMMGEVVGMAAAVCKDHNCLPRDVYISHLDELKEKMKKGIAPPTPLIKYSILPDWLSNPGENLALKAKIKVSSTLENSEYNSKYINDGKYDMETNQYRWVSKKGYDSGTHWVEFNFDQPTEINAFHAVSGMVGKQGALSNFIFQAKKDGAYVDIPETDVSENQAHRIAMKFPAVKTTSLRLLTHDHTARLWEVELFNIK